jgi:hypothetical protein
MVDIGQTAALVAQMMLTVLTQKYPNPSGGKEPRGKFMNR